MGTRLSRARYDFLKSLARDLERLGLETRVRRIGGRLHFSANVGSLGIGAVIASMKHERIRRVQEQASFVRRMLEKTSQVFADGCALDSERIEPSLHFCATPADFELFRLCTLMQSIPAPRLLYRQLPILVRDAGEATFPVIGAIGLASTVYSLGCRDALFGWQGDERKRVKEQGLKSCLQLSVCVAVPPYSYLRAGRLLAALALSEPVAAEYGRRYLDDGSPAQLLAIVTTSAMGLHGSIFNRIMLKPGGLYKRIGATTGYSAVFFSRQTLAAARRAIIERDGPSKSTTDRAIRTLKRAMDICTIPREAFVKLGIPKGVYVALAEGPALDVLRGQRVRETVGHLTSREIVEYWRRDVCRALANPGTASRLTRHSSNDTVRELSELTG